MAAFNRLTTTAIELQELLSRGTLTSVNALNAYLEQIDTHNGWLKAVIAHPPRHGLLERAKLLDDERREGKMRGPLHGIPVLVKDNIDTPSLEVGTTAGCISLVGAKAHRDAEIVHRLLEAGAIIIGKTNLSEFSFWKGTGLPCGWSALGGQTQSPYVRGGLIDDGSFASHSNCGGSSSGSAVGVAAGFAPISIDTETDGSLNMPATRTALYTIKPTIGIISGADIIPISPFADSAGLMAKCAHDIGALLDVLVDKEKTQKPLRGYESCMAESFAGLRIGSLDPERWKWPARVTTPNEGAEKQIVKETIAAYDKVQAFAEHFVQNLLLITKAEAEEEDKDFPSITDTFHALFKPAIESYLQGLESSPARTLKELVERNREIPGELPPGYTQQDILEKDLDFKLQGWDPEGAANHVRARALKRGDDILAEHRIDIIIGPGDSSLTSFACAAGYPMASLPIGVLAFNERPFGVTAITRAHGEALLVRLMSAWEKVFLRQLPESLKIAEDDWLKTQETFKETSASFEKVKRV